MKSQRNFWSLMVAGCLVAWAMIGFEAVCSAQQPLPLSDRNRMQGDTQKQADFSDVMSWRVIKEQTDFWGHPIQDVQILNRNQNTDPNVLPGQVGPDDTLDQEFKNRASRGFDLVVNGTFFDSKTGAPSGSVLRRGAFHLGSEKSGGRGAMCILQDGTIILGRAAGIYPNEIDQRFGGSGNPVAGFLGGGALMVEDRSDVTSIDLEEEQRFDQLYDSNLKKYVTAPRGKGGINAAQFRQTEHIVIAMLKGQAYVLVNKRPMDGAELQKALDRVGFETAVKFDGGSQCYFNDDGLSGPAITTGANNPTGLGITTPTFYVVCRPANMKARSATKPMSQWTLSDVNFTTTGGSLMMLEIKATALQFDPKITDSNQAEWFTPGAKIALPLKGSFTNPGGQDIQLDVPGLLEVVEVSRDPKPLMKKYPSISTQMQQPISAALAPLLKFENSNGTSSVTVQQAGGGGSFHGGPIEKGWNQANQLKHLNFVKQFGGDPLLGPVLQQQGCLVVSAYGTNSNRQLELFRRFRDDILQQSPAGRRLVDSYYAASSRYSTELERHPQLARFIVCGCDRLANILETTNWSDPIHRAGWDVAIQVADYALGRSSLDRQIPTDVIATAADSPRVRVAFSP